MEPSRYRKAYAALIDASRQLEDRFQQDIVAASKDAAVRETTTKTPLGGYDDDAMEWTPTGIVTPPAVCGPPLSASKNLRHLLPDDGDGEYRLEDKGKNGVLLRKLQEGVLVDEYIDKLVHDMPDVLSYEDSAAFTPSTIEVPKDFGLQLSISINHHLAQVADRKLLEKYRRLLGFRRDASKRKALKLGFDPVELIKKEAVTFPQGIPAQISTLDNDIHPIFSLQNFHGCPDAIYEVLKPALRLTTLFLLSRATSAFWHTLVFGDRKHCPQTSEQYGQPCYRIHKDVPWNEEHAAAFKSFVDEQVDTVHFIFHRNPLPADPAYASMGLVADYKNGLMRKLGPKCHTSRICLHSDFYTTAKKLSLLQYPDPAMVLRFNLFLAVSIAHEMSHFIEVAGPHHQHPLGEPEVFFHDNTWTESGIVFELQTFGGRLHPISSRVDCSLGLAVLGYPLRELYDKEDNVLYTLSMDYITKIQLKETWAQDFSDPANAHAFHVPRTGCRSIEINGTNLMVWEDEKDADISDHIDGRDTLFHRMDDGQIVRNPSSANRKSTKHLEGRRFNPYNRIKKNGVETGAQAVKDAKDVEDKIPADHGRTGGYGTNEEAQDTLDMDEEML